MKNIFAVVVLLFLGASSVDAKTETIIINADVRRVDVDKRDPKKNLKVAQGILGIVAGFHGGLSGGAKLYNGNYPSFLVNVAGYTLLSALLRPSNKSKYVFKLPAAYAIGSAIGLSLHLALTE